MKEEMGCSPSALATTTTNSYSANSRRKKMKKLKNKPSIKEMMMTMRKASHQEDNREEDNKKHKQERTKEHKVNEVASPTNFMQAKNLTKVAETTEKTEQTNNLNLRSSLFFEIFNLPKKKENSNNSCSSSTNVGQVAQQSRFNHRTNKNKGITLKRGNIESGLRNPILGGIRKPESTLEIPKRTQADR